MADTNVPITAGSGTNIDAQSVAGGDLQQTITIGDGTNAGRVAKLASTGEQLVSLSDSGTATTGNVATISPMGNLNVSMDAPVLFGDTFEGASVDVTNRWTFGSPAGTIPPTQTTGSLLVAPSTGASATSVVSSQSTFTHLSQLTFGCSLTLEASGSISVGGHRFWGLGTVGTSPGTSSVPLSDAIGFEISTAGVLACVVYTAGVRTVATAIGTTPSFPSTGAHRYSVIVRGDIAFWYMDNFTVPLATSSVTPNSQLLPVRFANLNAASVTNTPLMTVSGVVLNDQARNATGISDATYPWRRAVVGKNGGLSIRASSITGQTLAVTAATPITGTGLDVSEAGAVTFIVKNTVAATAFTGVPVMTFEQSDDNVSWAPLPVATTSGLVTATPTMTAGAANTSQMFDAALEGVNWVRVRVTTAQATNGMTVITQPGAGFFSPVVATGAVVSAAGALLINPTPSLTVGTATGTVWQARAAVTTATTASLQAAPAAGLALYITDLSVSNSGTALSVVSFLPTAGTSVVDIAAAANGGGGSMNFKQPLRITTATSLSYTTSIASTTVYITATGYTAA